ncbi:MAG TPA: hypothetical protein PKK00_10315 [Bacteroidales bacterium]|nr:hypothetical protein [Bacteroidales bacterium]HPS15904.1 hypothetical protein [Bacteroidales bacterium]
MNFFEKYKPSVNKRALLFAAGCVWCFAGCILIARGLLILVPIHHYLFPELLVALIFGICFYIFLFTKISKKHIQRISLLKIDYPCFFSFFNFKSYILMAVMITTGIILRKIDIINHEVLYTFYVAMGIPLSLSAVRFFISGIKNTINV